MLKRRLHLPDLLPFPDRTANDLYAIINSFDSTVSFASDYAKFGAKLSSDNVTRPNTSPVAPASSSSESAANDPSHCCPLTLSNASPYHATNHIANSSTFSGAKPSAEPPANAPSYPLPLTHSYSGPDPAAQHSTNADAFTGAEPRADSAADDPSHPCPLTHSNSGPDPAAQRSAHAGPIDPFSVALIGSNKRNTSPERSP